MNRCCDCKFWKLNEGNQATGVCNIDVPDCLKNAVKENTLWNDGTKCPYFSMLIFVNER